MGRRPEHLRQGTGDSAGASARQAAAILHFMGTSPATPATRHAPLLRRRPIPAAFPAGTSAPSMSSARSSKAKRARDFSTISPPLPEPSCGSSSPRTRPRTAISSTARRRNSTAAGGGAELRLVRASWDGDDDRAPARGRCTASCSPFVSDAVTTCSSGPRTPRARRSFALSGSGGNAEIVAVLDLTEAQFARLLPPSFTTEAELTFESVDPSGEDERAHDHKSFILSASYEAASGLLTLSLRPDAPPLRVAYLGKPIGLAARAGVDMRARAARS